MPGQINNECSVVIACRGVPSSVETKTTTADREGREARSRKLVRLANERTTIEEPITGESLIDTAMREQRPLMVF